MLQRYVQAVAEALDCGDSAIQVSGEFAVRRRVDIGGVARKYSR